MRLEQVEGSNVSCFLRGIATASVKCHFYIITTLLCRLFNRRIARKNHQVSQ